MSAEIKLERYIIEHPDYWEFEEEKKEVERLRALCEQNKNQQNVFLQQSYIQVELFNY